MEFIKATLNDLEDIRNIIVLAIKHMKEENNNQWYDENIILNTTMKSINNNTHYLVKENNETIGMFSMIYGIDDTYNEIDGKWINNEKYVTIHKIAVKYFNKHIASKILDFVIKNAISNNVYNIRIDTHEDNISMRKFLEKHQFIKCGIISITKDFNDTQSLRFAYQKILNTKKVDNV
jgi:predicted acetyltransferase